MKGVHMVEEREACCGRLGKVGNHCVRQKKKEKFRESMGWRYQLIAEVTFKVLYKIHEYNEYE